VAANQDAPQQQAQPGPLLARLPTNSAEAIRVLTQFRTICPPYAVVAQLRTNDEKAIIQLYNESELIMRTSYISALAAIGGDASAECLRQTLTADYQQRALSVDESIVMAYCMTGMGYVAARSSLAYDFLKEAVSPQYWEKVRTWRQDAPASEDFENDRFAGLAVVGLGQSARPEVPELLERLKLQDQRTRSLGSFVDAAFFWDLAQQKGPEAPLKMALGRSTLTEFLRWRQSENGRKAIEWRYGTYIPLPGVDEPVRR
jgi:hypothetical protein